MNRPTITRPRSIIKNELMDVVTKYIGPDSIRTMTEVDIAKVEILKAELDAANSQETQ